MGPVLLIGAGAVAVAASEAIAAMVPTEPESGSTADNNAVSSAFTSVVRAVSGSGALPTASQLATWRARHVGWTQPPTVPRVRTPMPPGRDAYDLRAFQREANIACGGNAKAGACITVLFSLETSAGLRPGVACWNCNVGNVKNPNRSGGPPSYFLIDRINSYDFYPSFETYAQGIAHVVALLSRPHYNRPGRVGAIAAMNAGDLRQFCLELGNGGYARSYNNPDDSLVSRGAYLMGIGRYRGRPARMDRPAGLLVKDSRGRDMT